jgi:hypothetical protein
MVGIGCKIVRNNYLLYANLWDRQAQLLRIPAIPSALCKVVHRGSPPRIPVDLGR